MAPPVWLDEVERAVRYVVASDAVEVQFSRPDFTLRIRRRADAVERASDGLGDAAASEGNGVAIVAPLTGIFYPGPAPSAPPYVAEGDTVQPDTIVGLIETMKIFNEVLAERRGRIRRILVESGQLVQAGHRLMLVEDGEGGHA